MQNLSTFFVLLSCDDVMPEELSQSKPRLAPKKPDPLPEFQERPKVEHLASAITQNRPLMVT
jgi:hypothetical protein